MCANTSTKWKGTMLDRPYLDCLNSVGIAVIPTGPRHYTVEIPRNTPHQSARRSRRLSTTIMYHVFPPVGLVDNDQLSVSFFM